MKTTEPSEIENAQEGSKCTLDIAEYKISKLEDIALEAVQKCNIERNNKIFGLKKTSETCRTTTNTLIYVQFESLKWRAENV